MKISKLKSKRARRPAKSVRDFAAQIHRLVDQDLQRKDGLQLLISLGNIALKRTRKEPIKWQLSVMLFDLIYLSFVNECNVAIQIEAMDSVIDRHHKSTTFEKALSIAVLAMSNILRCSNFSPSEHEEKPDELGIWFHNMFNYVGLMCILRGLDPISDCLVPLLQRLQKLNTTNASR